MVLVDTSSWIHFLRPDGDAEVRSRVEAALRAGTARWCPPRPPEAVERSGRRARKKGPQEFERLIPDLPNDAGTWSEACDLARPCRGAGVTEPATDILIAACARCHGAELEHADGDFEAIAGVSGRDDR